MSNLIGMDAGEVRSLANRIRTQAEALQGVVGRIDGIAHQIAQAWQGPDATEFVGWWQHRHRVELLKAHESLVGLAQSADNNAAQQESASSGGDQAGKNTWVPASIAGGAAGLAAFSNKWGFAAGPILTHIPKVGGPIGEVMNVDQAARLGQDVVEQHYQDAYVQGTGMAAGDLMAAKTPVTVLAGTDLIIGEHAEEAYRAVNWSYTLHHLSQLDPLAPGAIQAVASAEAKGLGSLGVDLFENSIGALLSP